MELTKHITNDRRWISLPFLPNNFLNTLNSEFTFSNKIYSQILGDQIQESRNVLDRQLLHGILDPSLTSRNLQ